MYRTPADVKEVFRGYLPFDSLRTSGKPRLRSVPYDLRVGSCFSSASAQSVGQPGCALRLRRKSAVAARNACDVVFALTQRAGRIAPET